MMLFIMKLSPVSCSFRPLSSKYSPQHPVLKHPQSMFFRQCDRPNFIATQNSRWNYVFLYIF